MMLLKEREVNRDANKQVTNGEIVHGREPLASDVNPLNTVPVHHTYTGSQFSLRYFIVNV
ncbi:hypothetical protein ACHAXM_007860 [Skeletonema potamos]|jgi:hypothetical protein